MDITYDYYRIFYYVAKYGSFSAAASVLLKGQPNITKTINNLESQLGCRLFIRSNRGAVLTAEGEKLYRHAQIAFENLSRAEEEITAGINSDSGRVSIAATETALYGVLISALAKFSSEYPGVKIKLTNFNSPQSLEAVKNGVADFGVVTLLEKPESIFHVTKICDFREILCCPKGYKYDPDSIFSGPYISINRDSYTYKYHSDFLLSGGIKKEPDIEVATSDQVLPLVKSGMGIGFISEFMANEALQNGDIEEIPLEKPPKKLSICLVTDKTKALSAAAVRLRKYLCEQTCSKRGQ